MYNQGTVLEVNKPFNMRKDNRGRFVNAKVGDLFCVTNTEYSQRNGIMVDRKSKAKIGIGYLMDESDVKEFFDVVEL